MKWLVILFLLIPTVAFGQQIDGKFVSGSTITGINASNISSGTLAAARGGAGTVNGVLAGNGSGAVSQGTCAGLSGVAASCATDATNASNIASGTLNIARYATYFQLKAGNATYGNSSPWSANLPVANEAPTVAGKIIHLSVQNLTGGACTTAPTWNVYVIHGGIESDGTALTGSTTQEGITAGPTNVAENKTFAAGDIIGIKMDTTDSPSGCNAPSFDPNMWVCVGGAC